MKSYKRRQKTKDERLELWKKLEQYRRVWDRDWGFKVKDGGIEENHGEVRKEVCFRLNWERENY